MNKKLFLGMLAATGMLFATSCSNDELNAVQSGDEVQVTFSLGLEGGLSTRAISDGTGAKKLVCAVYNVNGETPTLLDKISINNNQVDENGQYVDESAFDSGLTDNISVTLAKGQKYAIAFWAQNPDCTAYTTTDLQNISISYQGTNNDESRDAFYAVEEFEVKGNKEIDVTLKRPFAQINVGVYEEDWNAAVASGITIEQSSVVIKNAATALNLLTGNATEAQEATYTLGTIPREPLKVDTDNDGDKEEYNWLSMSYILVEGNTEQATLNSLQFTFNPADGGKDIDFKEGLNTVPVRRNWRTNILGKILTGDIQFNITIDPAYDGDIIYPDGSIEQELEFAAAFGGTVTLPANTTITLAKALNVTADMILNLNGSNIEITAAYDENNYEASSAIVNNAKLTLTGNGSIKATNNYTVRNNGTMIIDGVTIQNGIMNFDDLTIESGNISNSRTGKHAIYGNNAKLTINGGQFHNENPGNATVFAYAGEVVINDGEFSIADGSSTLGWTSCVIDAQGSAKYTINGGFIKGEIRDYNNNTKVYGGTFTHNSVEKFTAESYTAVKNSDGTWTVCKAVANEEDLKTAIAEGGIVALTNNVTLAEPLKVNADMTLNLGDYTIQNESGYAIINTANLTINSGEKGAIWGLGGISSTAGKLTITGGNYTASSQWQNQSYQSLLYASNSEIVINGGTFDATIGGITNAMIQVSTNSKITINGGTFRNVKDGETIPASPNYMFSYDGNGNGKLIINDGTFYGGWRFNGATATTDIYGGNFTVAYDGQSFHATSTHVLEIYGGTFSLDNGGELNPAKHLADDYEAVQDGNTWTVKAE